MAAASVAAASIAPFDNSAAVRVVNGIEVSRNDDRDYKYEELPNGLKILVVSDPKAELASVATVVRVGSYEDYKDLPGTAHALEHLCFMGSDKFPGENEWSSWLSAHGGMSNAYTASTATNYHYQVRSVCLKDSLERFSRFFVAPLLSEGAWLRELKNIDSEHSKNINNDLWRQMQLDRSRSNPSHANNRFATGNKATLHDDAIAAGIDVRKRLLDFHEKHYTASRMTVAVVGQEPAETLLEWARELFREVRDDGAPLPTYGSDPYEGCTQLVHTLVPIREQRVVAVNWAVPSQTKDYKTASSHLASHLLGHEGPGSILSELKASNLATGLSAGLFASEDDFATFVVRVDVTPLGLERADDVVAAIFAYCKMLRATGAAAQEWVAAESATIAASRFRFRGKSRPMAYATRLANQLCTYPKEHVVSGPELARAFSPEAYGALLDCFRPQHARVLVVAQDESIASRCDRTEPIYGSSYGEHAFTKEQLESWGGPTGDDASPVFDSLASLRLPDPNTFLATDFSIRSGVEPGKVIARRLADEDKSTAGGEAEAREVTASGETPGASAAAGASGAGDVAEQDPHVVAAARGVPVLGQCLLPTPLVLEDTEQCLAMWYQDQWFGEPKVGVWGLYELPHAYATVEASALSSLFVHAVTDELNELAYAAEIAGLSYSIDVDTRGLSVHVQGFNDKAARLLAKLPEALESYASGKQELSRDAVRRQLLRLRDAFANFDKEQPYALAMYETDIVTQRPYFHIHDKLRVFKEWAATESKQGGSDDLGTDVAMAKLREFLSTLFARGRLQAMVFGNVAKEEAAAMVELLKGPMRATGCAPLLPSDNSIASISRRGAMPPAGTNVRVSIPCRNPADANGAVQTTLFLGPRTPRTRALSLLLGQMMSEPAFDQLRTKEALGYIVFCTPYHLSGTVGVRVIVQSQLLPSTGLEKRAEAFLWHFRGLLQGMEDEAFSDHKHAVLSKLRQASSSLLAGAHAAWAHVRDGDMQFQFAADLAAAVQSLTPEDVRAVYDDAVAPGGAHRRRLGVVIHEGGDAAASEGAEQAADASKTSQGDGEGDAGDDGEAKPPAPSMTVVKGSAAIEALQAAAGYPGLAARKPSPSAGDDAAAASAASSASSSAPPEMEVLEVSSHAARVAFPLLPSHIAAGIAAWRLRHAGE